MHTTGYGDLHVTYDAIGDFCAANGLATTGDAWEIYGDPDENDHVDVEVVVLLADSAPAGVGEKARLG